MSLKESELIDYVYTYYKLGDDGKIWVRCMKDEEEVILMHIPIKQWPSLRDKFKSLGIDVDDSIGIE